MTAPTHLLIHRDRPGTGPQPGSPEYDDEMRLWERIDGELRSSDVLVAAYALRERGTVHRAGADVGASVRSLSHSTEIVFAVHAISVLSDAAAEEIAATMPHLDYGSVEVRPIME